MFILNNLRLLSRYPYNEYERIGIIIGVNFRRTAVNDDVKGENFISRATLCRLCEKQNQFWRAIRADFFPGFPPRFLSLFLSLSLSLSIKKRKKRKKEKDK